MSLNREEYFFQEFCKLTKSDLKRFIFRFLLQAGLYSIANCLIFFIQPVAYSFGFYLMKTANLSQANLFRIFSTLTFTSMIMGRIYSLFPDQKRSLKATKDVFRIVDRKSNIDAFNQNGLKPDSLVGRVRFDKVEFSYPNRPNMKILNDVCFEITENTTTALIGPSGV